MRIETKLAQIGTKKARTTGSINFPIYLATAYEHIGGVSTGYDYARSSNPTRHILEESIAMLEKGDAGFACSSGMAAIQTIMGLFSQGDHLIVSMDLYGGTYRLFEQVLNRYGIQFSYVDLRDIKAVEEAIQPQTKALFIETPTNPLMHVTDLQAITRLSKQYQLWTIVDNTFMTPYLLNPLELGANIVIHSATKYLGGHNDVLAGLIVTKGDELSERVRFLQQSIGATLSPMDSYLLMRGMKTLALRMERHQANAQGLAHFLKEHPLVDEVFFPEFDPNSKRILSEQAKGYGGMLSFRVKEAKLVQPFLEQLQVFTFAESLGGVESLLTYPATQTHADVPADIRQKVGVCDRLLRVSVGVEHIEDLEQDLAQALQRSEEIVYGSESK
ncbi:aminotransferase class I/II-fold pyridoxal phosphate-dependent enzyme [Thermoflavimicrobium daqui]|uniref:Methionine biosynthesis PLP-dependent protein n=1 Tax=Thermoflavimicrobium daqui TaxID=2137476 RepID=A0A364K2U3_9BACL|nr:aminotransferase class I/II-fold pyridoxal phosphate-dependent enzyme [Thermoflavimicrobium daqui]RAL22629.1 methionine biosynthesis PLP-dependent protein [Thermoflavimicrobium daqui]